MATMTLGPAGFSMVPARYMPFGGPFEQLVSSTPSTVTVRRTDTGDVYTFQGAFNGAASFASITGTINSLTLADSSGQTLYAFTGLSMPFAGANSYLSFANGANPQNWYSDSLEGSTGFEQFAIGAGGTVNGGAGNDTVIWVNGNQTYNGGGGTNTVDFTAVPFDPFFPGAFHIAFAAAISPTGAVANASVMLVNPNTTYDYLPQTPNRGTDTFTNFQIFIGSKWGPTAFFDAPGNHTFIGGGDASFNNTLEFGVGFAGGTQLFPAGTGPVIFNFLNGTAQNSFGGTDTFQNIKWFVTGVSTTVVGGPGSHIVSQLFSNNATLTFDYSLAPAAINANLIPGSGQIGNGYGGTDQIIAPGGAIPKGTFLGSAFDDIFVLDDDNSGNTIHAGAGLDRLSYGAVGNQALAIDLAAGTTRFVSNGTLFTSFSGVEHVVGGLLNDALAGNAGYNILDGGPAFTGPSPPAPFSGSDTLTGNGGLDIFVYGPSGGLDTITDMAAGAGIGDVIDLRGFSNLHSLADVLALATQNGADTVIDFGATSTGSNRLTLQAVQKTNLNADDFVFVGQTPPGPPPPPPPPPGSQAKQNDFNNDGNADILLQNVRTGDSYLWLVNGTNLVGNGPIGWTPGAAWQAKDAGDYNGDGRADVLLQNVNTGDCYLWELNGTSLVGNGPVGWTPGAAWQAKDGGDFNGDGKSDILLQNANTGACFIWELNGTSLVGNGGVGWTPGTAWQAKATGDFNGDGKSDIVLQNVNTGDVYIWELNGTSLVGNGAVGWTPGAAWQVKAAGDYNGDGKSDILLQNANTGACYIWELNGTSLVGNGAAGWTPGAAWQAKDGGDFNGDGKSDILLQNVNTGDAYMWLMNGTSLVGNGPAGWTPGADWHIL